MNNNECIWMDVEGDRWKGVCTETRGAVTLPQPVRPTPPCRVSCHPVGRIAHVADRVAVLVVEATNKSIHDRTRVAAANLWNMTIAKHLDLA